ncbi:MAG: zf-TFIIB domain-containing protein, partial [Pirellulaceae bacterium]|nr:zf-TFIIB domain-containing protein [Pirellulaceae bacterium]
MPIKLECPRCKKPLAVPRKKAGSYVHCPECGGRFWAPASDDQQTAEPTGAAPAQEASEPSPAVPPTRPPAKKPRPAPRTEPRPSGSVPSVAKPSREEPPGAPRKNVARFVSAEAAQSPLKLAKDGRLPELMLEQEEEKTTRGEKGRAMNPALLIGGVALSVVFSLVLLLWEPSASDPGDDKARARQTIRDNFFAVADDRPPLPYQQWLREAQRAASRGDARTERMLYQRVLDQLRA